MESPDSYKKRILKAFENRYITEPGKSTEANYGRDDVVDTIENLFVNGDLVGEIDTDVEIVVQELDAKLEEENYRN